MQPRREPLTERPGRPLALTLAFTLASALCASPAAAEPSEAPSAPVRTTWDANLDGGLGFHQNDQWITLGFGRLRAGVLHITEPWYLSAGTTIEVLAEAPVAFGLQAEAMHLYSGFWFQAGAMLDLDAEPGAMAALGWSLLGLEVQGRALTDAHEVTLIAKLRVPLRIIWLACCE